MYKALFRGYLYLSVIIIAGFSLKLAAVEYTRNFITNNHSISIAIQRMQKLICDNYNDMRIKRYLFKIFY